MVLVYGAGPVGLFHLALARLAGAGAVVVCEPNADRRRRALAGAPHRPTTPTSTSCKRRW